MSGTLDLVLAGAAPVAEGIRAFRLVGADGAPLPPFQPGAHVLVHAQRMDGTPAARAYSLVGDPADRGGYRIAVLRQGEHGVSAWFHAKAMPGARLQVQAPRNDFRLAPEATDHLLIAGGVGITPILAMSRDLAARGASFAVHYAARSPAHMALQDEIRAIAGPWLTTWFGSAGERLDIPDAIGSWQRGRHVYVCGPRGMIEATRRATAARGWPSAAVHFETFGAVSAEAERRFTVELAQSRKSFDVAPGQSILDSLFAAGVMPSFDCRRGECGACLTRILAGEPDHRDLYLTEEERAAGDFMTVCVSRSRTDCIVLDL